MARAQAVWGIDIGQCALKALKLREVEGRLQVEALEVIAHPKILSQPDADRPKLIQEALERFLANQSVSGCHVAVAVPGQSTFSRFVKLPPVEAKRIPEIVRFEAGQQIPFPIHEVIWRYQIFRDPDNPDVEVGIFAMKKSDVAEVLHHFNQAGLRVDTVQMAPLALYNFMVFDEQLASDGATLLADVGADKTDLVVADKGRIWTRTIQIGGNNFTEALARTFKLSFEKAEEHKITAAGSKYARQIFQAMRPVFADLVQELQRSIGFYTSLHRDTRFRKLIGLGNGFNLPGLQKFIEQNLNIPVTRIDSYNKLSPSSSVNVPALNENVLSLAVAYGLAMQGLGKVEVPTNLLPGEIVRKRLWVRKRPWFVAAALAIVAAAFCPGYRANLDSRTLSEGRDLAAVKDSTSKLNERIQRYTTIGDKWREDDKRIRELAAMFGYRDFWPALLTMVDRSVAAVAPQQPLLADYGRYLELKERLTPIYEEVLAAKNDRGAPVADADLDRAAAILLGWEGQRNLKRRLGNSSDALKAQAKTLIAQIKDPLDANTVAQLPDARLRSEVKRLVLAEKIRQEEAFGAMPRTKRQVLIVDGLNPTYMPDLGSRAGGAAGAGPTGAAARRGFQIELVLRTPLPQMEANKMAADLRQQIASQSRWMASLAVLAHSVEWVGGGAEVRPGTPRGAEVKAAMPDPLFEKEDMATDIRFKVILWVAVKGDGIVATDIRPGRTYSLAAEAELLPDLDPADATKAAADIKTLPAGSTVTIERSETKFTVPWYRVQTTDPAGKKEVGWIVGTAMKAREAEEGPEGE